MDRVCTLLATELATGYRRCLRRAAHEAIPEIERKEMSYRPWGPTIVIVLLSVIAGVALVCSLESLNVSGRGILTSSSQPIHHGTLQNKAFGMDLRYGK